MNAWLIFALSALVIVLAGRKLSQYGDEVAHQTGLGRAFVGAILLAGATSLPEIATSVAAASEGWGNLAMGNVFGSNIFNVAILVVAQLFAARRIAANVAPTHVTVAAAGMMLSGLAALAMVVRLPYSFAGVGLDALLIMTAYLFILRVLPRDEGDPEVAATASPVEPGSAWLVWGKFGTAAVVVVGAGWFLSGAADQIAVMTGLGETFVGGTLLAAATSLPELTVTIFTARRGQYDLAMGNVLGSNIFNMLILVLADLALPGGPMLATASTGQSAAALVGLVLAGIAVLALTSAPLARRAGRIGWETWAIGATYLAGTYLLFTLR